MHVCLQRQAAEVMRELDQLEEVQRAAMEERRAAAKVGGWYYG